jgi:SAM-dependent methyltransferase
MISLAKTVLAGTIKASMAGLRRGPHITRFSMYRRLATIVPPPESGARILSISHSTALCGVLGFGDAELVEANYPEVNFLSLPYRDGEFDYVVSDQVLEHVQGNPQLAVSESIRVLKPGGYIIHTTCFMNPIHGAPNDYWRFTPAALRLLCEKQSTVMEADGWGNAYVFGIMSLGLRYEGVPEARWHPFHWIATTNHPRSPVATWVVARKEVSQIE